MCLWREEVNGDDSFWQPVNLLWSLCSSKAWEWARQTAFSLKYHIDDLRLSLSVNYICMWICLQGSINLKTFLLSLQCHFWHSHFQIHNSNKSIWNDWNDFQEHTLYNRFHYEKKTRKMYWPELLLSWLGLLWFHSKSQCKIGQLTFFF